MSTRISTTLADDMMAKLNKFSKETGASRGAIIQIALLDYFKQREALEMLPEIMQKIDKLEKLQTKNED